MKFTNSSANCSDFARDRGSQAPQGGKSFAKHLCLVIFIYNSYIFDLTESADSVENEDIESSSKTTDEEEQQSIYTLQENLK